MEIRDQMMLAVTDFDGLPTLPAQGAMDAP